MSFWDRVAELPGLSAVVDYQPRETPWARYLTALHLRALDRAIDWRASDRYLDYGCGVGRIARWLAPRVAEVVGVDSSARMVAVARERCAQLRNVRFEVLEPGAGAATCAGGAGFDGATAIWVLQHILDDERFDAALAELASALRTGAALYVLDRLCRDPIVEEPAPEYLKLRSLEAYRASLARHGFAIERCRAISVGEQVLGRPWLTQLARRGRVPVALTAALDLAWAARQRSPFIADYLVAALRR